MDEMKPKELVAGFECDPVRPQEPETNAFGTMGKRDAKFSVL